MTHISKHNIPLAEIYKLSSALETRRLWRSRDNDYYISGRILLEDLELYLYSEHFQTKEIWMQDFELAEQE